MPEPSLGDTRDQMGKAFGVSGRLVDHATRVLDHAVPEVVQAVDEGRVLQYPAGSPRPAAESGGSAPMIEQRELHVASIDPIVRLLHRVNAAPVFGRPAGAVQLQSFVERRQPDGSWRVVLDLNLDDTGLGWDAPPWATADFAAVAGATLVQPDPADDGADTPVTVEVREP